MAYGCNEDKSIQSIRGRFLRIFSAGFLIFSRLLTGYGVGLIDHLAAPPVISLTSAKKLFFR